MIEKLFAQSSSPIAPVVSSPNVWQYILLFIYFLVCAALVTLVLVQTSKSEGLTGTLGGTTQSIFAGKRSFEEKLNRFTTGVAVAFIVLSILIAFLAF